MSEIINLGIKFATSRPMKCGRHDAAKFALDEAMRRYTVDRLINLFVAGCMRGWGYEI